MEKYLVPEPIGEGELSDKWIWFKREFVQFLTAIGKADASGAVKLAICMRVIGPRMNDVVDAIVFADDEDKSDFSVVAKLDVLCAWRSSKHVTRDRFFQLRQSGRTIDQFVTELRKKVKDCEFGTLKDDLMLHVLIRGLDSERMRRRLFETDKLELPKAIQMCQGMEATAADLQSWGEAKNGSPEVVAAVKGTVKESFGYEDSEGVALVSWAPNDQGSSSRNGAAMGSRTQESWVRRNPKGKGCYKCSRVHKYGQCPAFGQVCWKCKGMNHFAKQCTSQQMATQMMESGRDEEECLLKRVEKIGRKLLAVLSVSGKKQSPVKLTLPVGFSSNM